MIAQDRDDSQRRMEIAKSAHVVRDERLGDVDHVSRLHDQIGAQRVRLLDDFPHFPFGHVDAGVHIREVSDAQTVQWQREIGQDQRAPRDRRQSLGAPNAVCGESDAGGRVGIGGAS